MFFGTGKRYLRVSLPEKIKPGTGHTGKKTSPLFSEEDLTFILRLKDLIQTKKYSTAGAKKIVEDGEQESEGPGSEEISLLLKKDLREVNLFLNKLLEKL